MDILKEVLDTSASKVALGIGGIGITYLEFIPWLLRVLISAAIFANICVKTYKELKK